MAKLSTLKRNHNFLNGLFKAVIKSMIADGIDKNAAIDYIQDVAATFRQDKIFEGRKNA